MCDTVIRMTTRTTIPIIVSYLLFQNINFSNSFVTVTPSTSLLSLRSSHNVAFGTGWNSKHMIPLVSPIIQTNIPHIHRNNVLLFLSNPEKENQINMQMKETNEKETQDDIDVDVDMPSFIPADENDISDELWDDAEGGQPSTIMIMKQVSVSSYFFNGSIIFVSHCSHKTKRLLVTSCTFII